jgi:protein arginine kinase activator
MGMKCESESCENEATVHLTEIREGKKIEMHLCEKCAAAKGLPGKTHFSISELLAGIASQSQQAAARPRKGKETACTNCGTTLSQFQASGRFGCPECYVTFKDDVHGLVEKIHDASQHTGKVPHRVSAEISLQKDVRQLQLELKRAIRREDYEKAAAIRDQIRIAEEKMGAAPSASTSAGDVPPKPSSGGSSSGPSKKKGDGGEKK